MISSELVAAAALVKHEMIESLGEADKVMCVSERVTLKREKCLLAGYVLYIFPFFKRLLHFDNKNYVCVANNTIVFRPPTRRFSREKYISNHAQQQLILSSSLQSQNNPRLNNI